MRAICPALLVRVLNRSERVDEIPIRIAKTIGTRSPRRALAGPGGAGEGALVFGPGVDWLAVRDDHMLEGKLQQSAQRRQCAFLVGRRLPDAQLAAWRGQGVGEDDSALLGEPQRRLVASRPSRGGVVTSANDAPKRNQRPGCCASESE